MIEIRFDVSNETMSSELLGGIADKYTDSEMHQIKKAIYDTLA